MPRGRIKITLEQLRIAAKVRARINWPGYALNYQGVRAHFKRCALLCEQLHSENVSAARAERPAAQVDRSAICWFFVEVS